MRCSGPLMQKYRRGECNLCSNRKPTLRQPKVVMHFKRFLSAIAMLICTYAAIAAEPVVLRSTDGRLELSLPDGWVGREPPGQGIKIHGRNEADGLTVSVASVPKE